jgi:hypothetical protein
MGNDMKREEALELANEIAVFASIWIDDESNEVNDLVKFAQLAFEKGRQQGMKQERALWELAKSTQELGGYDS